MGVWCYLESGECDIYVCGAYGSVVFMRGMLLMGILTYKFGANGNVVPMRRVLMVCSACESMVLMGCGAESMVLMGCGAESMVLMGCGAESMVLMGCGAESMVLMGGSIVQGIEVPLHISMDLIDYFWFILDSCRELSYPALDSYMKKYQVQSYVHS